MTVVSPSAFPSLNVTLSGIPTPLRSSGGPRPAPGTINRLFFEAIERFDHPNALSAKVRGVWEPMEVQDFTPAVVQT